MRRNTPVTQTERTFSADVKLISSTDLKGIIRHCNQAFAEVSGFTQEELIGQPHNLVRHPDMPVAAFENMWSHLKSGSPWMGIVKNRCKNGDFYWVHAYVTPLQEHGKVVGYESVRIKPSASDVARASALYARLNSGAALTSWRDKISLRQIVFIALMSGAVFLWAAGYPLWAFVLSILTGAGHALSSRLKESALV